MADPDGKEPFLGLSWLQLIAGALAAMTSAWIASSFGVSGTIVGAAVGSLSASIATAFYMQSLTRGHRLVRRPSSPDLDSPGSHSENLAGESKQVTTLDLKDSADGPGSNGRRNRQIIIGTVVALVLALGTIGALEFVSGNPFGQAERPAIGRPWQAAPTESPTPTPTVTTETGETPSPETTVEPSEPIPVPTETPATPDPTPTPTAAQPDNAPPEQ